MNISTKFGSNYNVVSDSITWIYSVLKGDLSRIGHLIIWTPKDMTHDPKQTVAWVSEWVSDCFLRPIQQFFSYIIDDSIRFVLDQYA